MSAGRRRAVLFSLAGSYAARVFGIATQLVLVPFFLRFFDLETYGGFLATSGAAAMLGLADAGFTGVLTQRLAAAAGREDRAAFVRATGSGLLLVAIAGAVLGLAGHAIADPLPAWLGLRPGDRAPLSRAFEIVAWAGAATLWQQGVRGIVAAWQRTLLVGAGELAAAVLGIVATVAGLLSGHGVVALAIGVLVRSVAILAVTIAGASHGWFTQRYPRPRLELGELRAQVGEASFVFGSRVGGVLVSQGEATFVAKVLDPQTAALLQLTRRAFDTAALILNPLAWSMFPALAHLHAEGGRERSTHVVDELLVLSAAGSAIVFGVVAAMNPSFVLLWVGAEAWGGAALSLTYALALALAVRVTLLVSMAQAFGSFGPPAMAGGVEALLRLGATLLVLAPLGPLVVPSIRAMGAAVLVAAVLPGMVGRALGNGAPCRPWIGLVGFDVVAAGLVAGASLSWSLPPAPDGGSFVLETVISALVVGAISLATPGGRRAWGLVRAMLPAARASREHVAIVREK